MVSGWQREVAQPDVVEKAQPRRDFALHPGPDLGFGALQLQLLEPMQRLRQRDLADLVDGAGLLAFANVHVARLRPQAAAVALRADLGAAQTRQLFAHGRVAALAPAPLEVGQQALEGVAFAHRLASVEGVVEADGLRARAVQQHLAHRLGQVLPGGFEVEAVVRGQVLQHAKGLGVAPVPAFDGASGQAQAGEGHHPRRVEALHVPQALAAGAGPEG